MAGIPFPSYCYNSAGQAPVIVQNQAAFQALGGPGSWAFSPFPTAIVTAPIDTTPVLTATDIRLQQSLIEQRMTNLLLQMGFSIADDLVTQLRPDILANDSSLTS